MSGAFESTLLSPPRSTNKLFMETGFGVNAGFERYRNSEYAVSDGATSNRAAGIYGPFDAVNNPREWVSGAASLTIAAVLTVPTSALAASAEICTYSPATNNPAQAFGLRVILRDLGNIQIAQLGASGYSTLQQFESASTFRSTYSGQTGLLKIYFVQGTTDPVVSWNGVNISSSFTRTTAGTVPAWLDAAMVPTYRLVGYNWPSGPAPIVTPILGATSAGDDAFYMATGKWPAWVVAGGSAVNKISNLSRNSVFSAGVGATDWDATALTIDTTSGSLVITASTADARTGLNPSFWGSVVAGYRYRVTLTVSAFSSTGGCRLVLGLTNLIIGTITGTGTQSFDFTSDTSSGSANVQIRQTNAGTMVLTVDDISIMQLGALSLPAVQPINVLDDVSGIGTNCGLILGAATTATSNKKVWRIADLTKTSGNEQLLGGAVFVGTSQDYIKSWTIVNAGGTTTVSLGNVSGGAQYVSGLSVPTGTTIVTLLTNTPLTTNLWCNANSTASLTHIIEGYRTV